MNDELKKVIKFFEEKKDITLEEYIIKDFCKLVQKREELKNEKRKLENELKRVEERICNINLLFFE